MAIVESSLNNLSSIITDGIRYKIENFIRKDIEKQVASMTEEYIKSAVEEIIQNLQEINWYDDIKNSNFVINIITKNEHNETKAGG